MPGTFDGPWGTDGGRIGEGERVLTRRQLLRYGAGAALGVPLLSAVGTAQDGSAGALATSGGRRSFPSPPLLRSRRGRLEVTLVPRRATVDMRAPKMVTTYTYNGLVPGHTWDLEPGDLLSVHLKNRLPVLSDDTSPIIDIDRPHHYTVTNLHTHGLHVSPSDNSDNIFLAIEPEHDFDYEFHIPTDHPGGFFWYHPHHHGSVTQQVRAGLAGAIIVRGAIDDVPEIRAAQEQVMVLQSIELNDQFTLADPIPFPSKTEAFFPRSKVLYTVNGVLNPTVTLRPGEVQRWRLVNAAEGKFLSLTVLDQDKHVVGVHAIAWDGLPLAAPDPTGVVMLSSGNRAELLVQFTKPGTYQLQLTPGSSQKPTIPGMPDELYPQVPGSVAPTTSTTAPGPIPPGYATMASLADIPGELEIRPILTIVVEGDPVRMELPGSLPAWNPSVPPVTKTRQLSFTVQRDGLEFMSFGVNGVPYDPYRQPYGATLGTTEEWTLVNGIDPKYMTHAHVFHIHVNPFKITKINGNVLATPLWRDTFVLTKTDLDSLTFETTFADFTGAFVEHCHVLSHEDLGMMEAISVVPPGAPPPPPPGGAS